MKPNHSSSRKKRLLLRIHVDDLTEEISSREIHEVAGGSFSDIFVGYILGKKVALRTLRQMICAEEKTLKRFLREAEIWASLDHPNVLPFLGVCEFQPRIYMVSPWMEHGNACQYLERYPDTDREKLLLQLADALQYLHSKKIVHGDIKPDNVLIDSNGNCILADFGLASLREDVSWLSRSSTTLRNAGTRRFMAPELFDFDFQDTANEFAEEQSHSGRSLQSDVYAFGGLAYQLISDKRPFDHIRNDYAVSLAIMHGKIPIRPSTFPDNLWQLCERCWSKNREERPSMESIMTLIKSWRSKRLEVSKPQVTLEHEATPPNTTTIGNPTQVITASRGPALDASTSAVVISSLASSPRRKQVKRGKKLVANSEASPSPLTVLSTPNRRSNKICGHNHCELFTPSCCSCMDQRPHAPDGKYETYVDGKGFVEIAERSDGYCFSCRLQVALGSAGTTGISNQVIPRSNEPVSDASTPTKKISSPVSSSRRRNRASGPKASFTGPNPYTPDQVSNKICGHNHCDLSTPSCCSCMDQRPHAPDGRYEIYVDGIGFLETGARSDGYCSSCRSQRG